MARLLLYTPKNACITQEVTGVGVDNDCDNAGATDVIESREV
jgi:hypothetical protein